LGIKPDDTVWLQSAPPDVDIERLLQPLPPGARCIRRVTTWALLLVCIVFFGFAESRYIRNFVLGPFDLGPAELESIKDASETPRYFAKVNGSKAIETGIQVITIRKRRGGAHSPPRVRLPP
jgi:hypothetical protein